MRPGRTIILTGLLLAGSTALAHFDKPVDRNGGHWDQGGSYHCHEANCRPAPHRYTRRGLLSLTNRAEDLWYLEEDWPHWLLLSGCKTSRTVVLENTSRAPVTWTNPRQCELREGLWEDPYSGDEYTRAAQLEVDHIKPVRTHPHLAFDPANLQALAPACHTKKTRIECGHPAPIITPERQAWGKAVAELATNPNPAT